MAGQVHICSQAEVGESIEGENTFKRGGMTERTAAQGRHEMMEPSLVPRDEMSNGSFVSSNFRQVFVEPIYFWRKQETGTLKRWFWTIREVQPCRPERRLVPSYCCDGWSEPPRPH